MVTPKVFYKDTRKSVFIEKTKCLCEILEKKSLSKKKHYLYPGESGVTTSFRNWFPNYSRNQVMNWGTEEANYRSVVNYAMDKSHQTECHKITTEYSQK